MDRMSRINGLAILMLGASFSLYLSRDIFARLFLLGDQSHYLLELLPLVLMFGGFSILVFQYLRGEFLSKKYKTSDFESKITNSESPSDYLKLRDRVDSVDSNIKKVFEALESLKEEQSSIEFSKEEKQKLIDSIKDSVDKNVTSELLQSIDQQYSTGALRKNNLQQLLELYKNTERRLKEHLYELDRKAKLNLFIGSITTVGAVIGLAYIVFSTKQSFTDISASLNHYIPKISFILLIEVFSFFFLKLYKQILDDVKYHNNELTNIDSRIIALKAALFIDDKDSVKEVISSLSKTERNFILRKGETTVELEKAKDSRASFKDAVDSLTKLYSKTKGRLQE